MKKCCLILVLTLAVTCMSSVCFVSAAGTGSITVAFDKAGITSVGQIITAAVNISEISNFAGYQLNLVYDPAVLQPVKVASSGAVSAYTADTVPDDGILLKNDSFSPFAVASNDLNNGVLNFGKAYLGLDAYKKTGAAEKTGSAAVIKFKVLQVSNTNITFNQTPAMPGADYGVSLFDWDSKAVSGYTVIQPKQLTVSSAIMYGDVDGSNTIDALDFSFVKMYLLRQIKEFPAANGKLAADVDRDGQITALDFVYIKQYLLGVIKDFPVQN